MKRETEQFLISNSFPVRLEKGIEFFHFKKGITFLDYQLKKNNQKIKGKKHPSHFCLLIPKTILHQFAVNKGYGSLNVFQSLHRGSLAVYPEIKILLIYNRELKIFTKKYMNACNFHYLIRLYDLAESSFVKTLAFKRKCSTKKVRISLKKYNDGKLTLRSNNNGNVFSFITYNDMKRKRDI